MLFPYFVDMAVPVFMIISGYVYFCSFRKNKIEHFEDAYKSSFFVPKIFRYFVPFLITIFVEFVLSLLTNNFNFSFLLGVIRGGFGPGSYYFPVMIQFVFVYPIIYFLIQEKGHKGFFICIALNILYEFFQRTYFITEECYRLLIFRYISVISFGSFLASRENCFDLWDKILSFCIGAGFIFLISYTSYKPKIIIYWTGTSFLATLYILPICDFMIKKCTKIRIQPLEWLGKASFNIFLVQMVYFNYIGYLSFKIFEKNAKLYFSLVLQNGFNILLCSVLGLMFYAMEKRITNRILTLIKISNFRSL